MLDLAVINPTTADPPEDAQSDPLNSDVLIGHIERFLQAGRPAAARPVLLALRSIAPHTDTLSLLEARLLVAEGRAEAAIALLGAAIAAATRDGTATDDPTSVVRHDAARLVDLYLLRGEIQVATGHLAPALDDTAAAVMVDPRAPMAKFRLGVLLTQIGRFDDAIACLRESVASAAEPASIRGLAMAYERSGRPDAAAELLAGAIRTWPKDQDLRAASVMLSMRARNFADAIATAESARQDGAINAEIFALMGDALAWLGRHAEAAEAYHDGLKFSPQDMVLPHYAALSSGADANRGPALPVIRTLNDLAAADYDQQVLARADRVPGLIRLALQRERGTGLAPGPVLDLGCGTGLIGLAIAEWAGPLTGYDISPAMLAGARAKRIYAELREGDLLTLLASDARCWKLIVAGGSLPWFGALEAVFGLAHSRLSPGGRFIFSLADMATFTADGAAHPDVGWRLARGGCHVHRRDYIERALTTAGLVAHRFESEILCQEAEVPLPGWIFVAGRDEAQESGR